MSLTRDQIYPLWAMDDMDTALRRCLMMLMMGDQMDSQPKPADFKIVIAAIRELEAAVATKLGKPQSQESETLTEFTRGLHSSLHTTLVTLEYLASVMRDASNTSKQNLTEQYPQNTPNDHQHIQPEKKKVEPREFYKCNRCSFYHPWGVPWTVTDCKRGSKNCFLGEDLDKQYPLGWIRRPQPEDGRLSFEEEEKYRTQLRSDRNLREHLNLDDSPSSSGTPPPDHRSNLEPKSSAPSDEIRVSSEAQRPTVMREGSNGDKIYQASKEMLMEHGNMHLDDILTGIEALGLFGESVKDRRIRLSNLLSQYKAKGLMTSDGRGNWSLLKATA